MLVPVGTPADRALAQDDSRPKITSGPTITSGPASGDTYRASEAITLALTFSEPVTVTETPRLRLKIGDKRRWARYGHTGEDGATLSFAYVVKKKDADADGVSIGKNQLKLNGGSIEDADGNAARLKHPALPHQDGHKVNGASDEPESTPAPTPELPPANSAPQFASDGEPQSAPQEETDNIAPTVSSLRIASTPAAHDSYAPGETITMEVTFSESVVVTSTPCLLINVGQVRRGAAYASGSGTDTLRFNYTVVTGDRDRRGVGVYGFDSTSWPLRLSCTESGAQGTIRDAADNDADLRHNWFWGEKSKHMVGGPDVIPTDRTGPTVTDMRVVSSPASGDTYRDGETILIGVTFSEPVVAKSPRLAIWIGLGRKELTFRGGSHTKELTFGYRVRSNDRDTDGIIVLGNQILVVDRPDYPAISDSADNRADVDHSPMNPQAGHKVAGSTADSTPPTVEEIQLHSAPGSYLPGDELIFHVTLSEHVQVVGAPYLNVTVGGKSRTATYQRLNETSMRFAAFTSVMSFSYTVQEGDVGVVGVARNGLQLPQGSDPDLSGCITLCARPYIRDLSDNDAILTHDAVTMSRHSVPTAYIVGRKLSITSTPAEGDTYRAGETITVSVTFNTNVTVTGTPRIGLRVDPNRNGHPSALYSSGSGTKTLTFAYVVASGITAANGIATDLFGFQLDGATIKDADGNNAYLAHHQLEPQTGHKVDGDSAEPSSNSLSLQSTSVSAGDAYTCAVKTDGSLACWGSDGYGRSTPPAGSFVSVSAGSDHACGVKTDGAVACWGRNGNGQATPPSGSFASVSAGAGGHTCGVKTDGAVACWGYDGWGYNLGRTKPPSGSFASVSAGYDYTCGVKTNGAVACWGSDRVKPPSGSFASISAGNYHACGVKTDGAVACWGSDGSGQATATPPSGAFASVSAGGSHTCGVKTDDSLTCWGKDLYGQAKPPSGAFASVSAGYSHTCGVKTDGSLACWGRDGYGPAKPPSGAFASVSAGGSHTCGVKTDDGTVACWGHDDYGQATPPSGAFASVSAGGSHTCGVKTDGSLACWGANWSGQATPPSGTFASVSAGGSHTCGVKTDGSLACWGSEGVKPPSGAFASVSAGNSHTCGVKTDGSVACWSSDNRGRATTPPSGSFASVSAGYSHTCGVKTDGSVTCWDDHSQATPPSGSFASVSAGYSHTCGVKTDGSVACWGANLSVHATPPSASFASVSAGGGGTHYNTCGVKTNGFVACWGNYSYEQ